ncbi:STAS domain-containing protein [Baekduia sp. Peel2402]|uniref:STAS domain-containing protein n=1 Tax=Baekduia sp. Peel2402 TaxID=3458296 RepID=UPI00403E5399
MEGVKRHDVEHIDDHTAVITLHPDAGTSAGEHVRTLLSDLLAQGVNRLVIDLRGPQMLNSKVLDALVRSAGSLHPRDGAGLAVITEQQYVRTILQITATGGMLYVAESRDEALDALPPRQT